MKRKKIGIFRALYLGDMLCIIPVARALRKAYPDAEIFLIGLSWQTDFVARFPEYFDHLIEFPGWPGLPEQVPDPERILKFLNAIRTYQFDLLLQMQGNGDITNSMCMLWGAKQMCGLRRQGGYASDETLFPLSEDGEHEILRFMKLLDTLDIPHDGTHLEFPIASEEWKTYEKIAREQDLMAGEYVCVHPGARDPRRRWPVENFAVISNELVSRGKKVVITGSRDENELLSKLQKQINGEVLNIVERYGHLSAGALAAILKNSALLVSNDTGVSHIASALQVNSVILFSPFSDIQRWRPLDTTRHTIIPYERTGDVAYVLDCVEQKITSAGPAVLRTVPS